MVIRARQCPIFNGAEWNHFGIPDPVPNRLYPASDIAPVSLTRGLIFYALDKLQGEKARSRVGMVLAEFHAKGAELGIPVTVCRPTAIPTFAHNPLQTVGVRGSADVSGLDRQVGSAYQGVSLAASDYPEGSISSPSLSSGQTSLSFGGLGSGTGALLETLLTGGQGGADGGSAVSEIMADTLQDLFVLAA